MSEEAEKGYRETKKTSADLTPPRRFRRHKSISLREGAEDIFYASAQEKYEAEKGGAASRSFTELATGIKPRRILQAKITGYRDRGEEGPSAIAMYVSKEAPSDRPVTVIIPYRDFTQYGPEDLARMHIASRKIYLKKQQGKIIDFIPTGARQMGENTYFYGSRVQAMKDLSWEFWFSYLKGTSKYRFNVGSVIYGRVVDVFEAGIRVDIYGAEQTVPRKELAWYWITDAREEFEVGQQIPLMITKLTRSGGKDREDPFFLQYECSARLATRDPHIDAAQLISAGDYTIGTIIRNVPAKEGGKGYVLVRPLDMKIDVHCPYPGEGEENFPFQQGSVVEIKYAAPKKTDAGRARINAKMKHLVRY